MAGEMTVAAAVAPILEATVVLLFSKTTTLHPPEAINLPLRLHPLPIQKALAGGIGNLEIKASNA